MRERRTSNTEVGGRLPIAALVLGLALVVSAYGMARAIESPEHWWLGWVALLPLFASIRVLSPIQALLAGGLWGLSLFVSAVAATNASIAPSATSLVLLCLVPALYTYLGARLTRQVGFSPYLLALGWVGVELALRPLGLRHGLLAATQGDGWIIRLFGSLAGYALVAFVVAYVNAVLLSVLSRVPVSTAGQRFVRGPSPPLGRRFDLDGWHGLFHLIRPAQPRAPPVA